MTNPQAKEIEKLIEEAEKKQNEDSKPENKQSFWENIVLRERIKQIVAIEEKLYGRLAKTRKVVSVVAGATSGAFTGYEFMEMYNLFYNASLYSLINQNSADINQMKVEQLIKGVDPDKIQLPIFSDAVKELLPNFGIDPAASSADVILDAMSKGVFDFSTLDPTTGILVATLVTLSSVFAGFEVNNFFKNRIRIQEQKKIAAGEAPTFIQIKEKKKAQKEKEKQEKEEAQPENQHPEKEEEFKL